MKTLIVEDSRIAREGLLSMLSVFPQLELLGATADAYQARAAIEQERPELLFLDIQMPGETGFELLDSLPYQPKVIFTTAHSDYAIQSFEHQTVDYLLKPISTERLRKAVEKLSIDDGALPPNEPRLDINSRVFIQSEGRCHLVPVASIDYLESCKNYARLSFGGNTAFVKRSLNQLEERLPSSAFVRANRQYIINLHRIVSVEEAIHDGLIITMRDGTSIDISRRAAARLKAQLYL